MATKHVPESAPSSAVLAVKAATGHICYYCEPNDDGSRSSMHGNCIGYDVSPSVRSADGEMPVCTCPCRAFRSQR